MKHQVIILDGPDGCGKTNIGLALAERLGISYFKNEGEWDHFADKDKTEYFLNCIRYRHPHLLEFLNATNTSVVLDRAYPSEFVYPGLFNRETDPRAVNLCDVMCAEMNAKIIIPCRSDYSEVKDQFDFVDEEMLNKIHKGYKDFSCWTSCDVLMLNVDDEDLEREIKDIMVFLEGE